MAFWETEHVTTHDRGACRQDQHQEILPPGRGLQYDQGGMLLQSTFYNVKDTGVYFYYILSIEMYHLCNANVIYWIFFLYFLNISEDRLKWLS